MLKQKTTKINHISCLFKISSPKNQNFSNYFKVSGKASANLSMEPFGKGIFAARAF